METPAPPPDTIVIEVRRIIAEAAKTPVEAVSLDDTLDEARLGIDSLALIKLNVLLEERFDITIPDFVATEIGAPWSVRHLAELVAARVQARPGGAS